MKGCFKLRNKNIYMGPNSTAQIPVHNKIDTDQEIITNVFATGYDALNSVMLTRRSGYFDKTTMQEINGRFGVLRMLCSRYSPKSMMVLDEIYKIVSDNYHGLVSDLQALGALRQICLNNNLDPFIIDNAVVRINQAEQLSKKELGFDSMFPFWIQSKKDAHKKNHYFRRSVF
jgi:hypothetical protein